MKPVATGKKTARVQKSAALGKQEGKMGKKTASLAEATQAPFLEPVFCKVTLDKTQKVVVPRAGFAKAKPRFMKGNEAIAHALIAGEVQCYFGYPITPQNEIPETLSVELPKVGGVFVQAESELAASNMLLGAVSTGIRACISSSSPGISLMQETISYMAGSELPGFIVNMNRGGPGLGDIFTGQGDYYQSTRGGGHGDYRTLTLAPSSCQEAYDLTLLGLDLAYTYNNPVILHGDGIIGTMKEPVRLWQPAHITMGDVEKWQLTGCAGRDKRLIKSVRLAPESLPDHNRHLQAKYARMQKEARAELMGVADAKLIIVAFGSAGRIAKSAIRQLRAQGKKVGLVRPITLYPFPEQVLASLAAQGKDFLTIENNAGQMVDDVRLSVRRHADSDFFGYMSGELPSSDDFIDPISSCYARLGRKG